MEQQRVEQCENTEYSVTLGLTADGRLMLLGQSGHWEDISFCENYAGYYPECRFTAIACGEGTFYAAGIDREGKPHLFTSLMGNVWNETKLVDFQAKCQAAGRIVRILYEKEENQAYVICENGDLITVPDCVHCIRIRQVTEQKVLDGMLEGRDIILRCQDGSQVKIPMSIARQYRASVEYVAEQISGNSGYLIDFRSGQTEVPEEVLKEKLPERLRKETMSGKGVYVSLDYSEFRGWLGSIPKSTVIAFICESGILAEEAVLYARRSGWRRAYALKV